MTAVILLAGLIGVCLGGLGLAVLLTESADGRVLTTERIGLAFPLGTALTGHLLFDWSLVGGRLSGGLVWSICGAGSVMGLVVLIREQRRRSTDGRRPGGDISPASSLAVLCRAAIVLLILGTFVLALMTPQRFWDERAIFGIKSQVLASTGMLDSPTLRHPDFVQGHPRYPLLLPLAESHVYLLLGRIDDRWSKAVFPLLFAGLVLTYAGVLSRRFGEGFGWTCGLLLATLPLLAPYELGFITGQGDAPVACYHGLAVLYAWDLLWRGSAHGSCGTPWRRGALIGTLAAAAAFAKDEGIAHLMVGGIALTTAWWWGRRSARGAALSSPPAAIAGLLRLAAAIGVTVAVLLGPWFLHRRTLPLTNEMQYFARFSAGRIAEQLAALQWLIPHLASRMFREWSTWGVQWWLLVVAMATAPRRLLESAQFFVLLEILGGIAALMVAGMIAPAELYDHIGGSSHRYLMQLAPLAVLFAAGQWGRDSGESKADGGRVGT